MTDVSLREFFERVLVERERYFELYAKCHALQHALEQRELVQAREQVDLRLEKLNELRSEVVQDRGQYVRREVFEAEREALQKAQQDTTVLVVERLSVVEKFNARVAVVGVIAMLAAGMIGATVMKVFGG